MNDAFDLNCLGDCFPAEDIEWKPIAVSRKTNKGLAAAYLTNRAIMDRLDEVCGPANWRNEFVSGPNGGVLCGLSIRVPGPNGEAGEWVTKWDGAENTDIEPVKGGLSSAMRRAAVQWGIGRYLYKLPQQWVPVDERGRFSQVPTLGPAFLPAGAAIATGARGSSGDGSASGAPPVIREAPPKQPARRTSPSPSARPVKRDVDEFLMPGADKRR